MKAQENAVKSCYGLGFGAYEKRLILVGVLWLEQLEKYNGVHVSLVENGCTKIIWKVLTVWTSPADMITGEGRWLSSANKTYLTMIEYFADDLCQKYSQVDVGSL